MDQQWAPLFNSSLLLLLEYKLMLPYDSGSRIFCDVGLNNATGELFQKSQIEMGHTIHNCKFLKMADTKIISILEKVLVFFFRSKSVLCGDTPFPWGWVVTGKIIKKYWTLTYNEFFLSSNERKMPKTILLLLQKKAFLYIITSIYVRLLMLLFENAHLLSYLCPNTSFFLQK